MTQSASVARAWRAMIVLAAGLHLVASAAAADWPSWGGTPSRNMMADEAGLPGEPNPTDATLAWTAKLGSEVYGTPVVARGKVIVGTNNAGGHDPRYPGDRCVLLCLDEATGAPIWQLALPNKLSRPQGGFCSTAAVDGDRVYVVTVRDELLCLDIDGLADGNDGLITDESRLLAPQGRPPFALGGTDPDIIWCYDIVAQHKPRIHDAVCSSPLVVGDIVYVGTSNAVSNPRERGSADVRACSAVIALDKRTGAFLAGDDARIGERLIHGSWSSPSYADVDGQGLVFFGGDDGFCYAFAATPSEPDDAGKRYLTTRWSFDGNPAKIRANPNAHPGLSPIIATPVFYRDRVYVATGEDQTHGKGWGNLSCIDATKTGDITATGAVWTFTGINRTTGTVAIAGGLLYITDVAGHVFCLDAETGVLCWSYTAGSAFWGSPLVADGKLYVATYVGDLLVFATGRALTPPTRVRLAGRVATTPIAANGTLYVAAFGALYAFRTPQSAAALPSVTIPPARQQADPSLPARLRGDPFAVEK
jgi:outer membrane protein assembly factor BamB